MTFRGEGGSLEEPRYVTRGEGGSKSGLKKATWFVYGPLHLGGVRFSEVSSGQVRLSTGKMVSSGS